MQCENIYEHNFCAMRIGRRQHVVFFAVMLVMIIGIASLGNYLLGPELLRAAGISVPFVLQAPHSRWVQPYEDACEEAVIVMLDAFFRNDTRDKLPADEARTRILRIVELEQNVLGYDKDTSIATMIKLVNEHFDFGAYAVRNPSLEEIKAEIDRGFPAVIPVWGRALIKSNPYFRKPGPRYHTILITGYDDAKSEFVTQEPGVGRGRNFRYPYAALMGAMGDLMQNKKGTSVQGGERMMMFVRPLPKE